VSIIENCSVDKTKTMRAKVVNEVDQIKCPCLLPALKFCFSGIRPPGLLFT
jgi:hypothetical protein